MKRQRGRNRSGGGGGNQGGKPQHNANRAFDSNGPEGIKVRGAAQGVFEKYQQLSRDAASGGDRVLAENYLQHAEHYFRTLRAMQPHRPVSDIVGREQFASGFDIDFEAEPGEPPEGGYVPETEGGDSEGQRDNSGGRDNNQGGQRFDGNRPRDGQRFEGRDRQRDDRPREDRPQQQQQPREDRPQQQQQPRDDKPRQDGEGGGRRDRWRERDERRDRERAEAAARDPLAVIEPQAAAPLAPEPAADSPRLRGQDGAVSELPAFLGRPATVSEEAPADEVKKPRRRRAPRTFEGGDSAKPETEEA